MPTGYTHLIETGKVTTAKEFLHLCLRAFGCLGRLREYPLEVKKDYESDLQEEYWKDIQYHKKCLEEAKKRMKKIQQLTDDELCTKYIDEVNKKRSALQAEIREDDINNGMYTKLRYDIEKWDCDEKFQNIKDFALNQIRMSVHHSTALDEGLKSLGKPTREDFLKHKDEYVQKMIDDAQWDIDYHTKNITEIEENLQNNLKFYKEFKENLNKLK